MAYQAGLIAGRPSLLPGLLQWPIKQGLAFAVRPAAARPAALPAKIEAVGPAAARRPAHRRPAALPARPPA
eukprot:4476279-Prymnesium_polylepis.1